MPGLKSAPKMTTRLELLGEGLYLVPFSFWWIFLQRTHLFLLAVSKLNSLRGFVPLRPLLAANVLMLEVCVLPLFSVGSAYMQHCPPCCACVLEVV